VTFISEHTHIMDFAKIRLPDTSKPEKRAWKVLSSVALGTMTDRWRDSKELLLSMQDSIQVVGSCGVQAVRMCACGFS
jgi:hypothetical protein